MFTPRASGARAAAVPRRAARDAQPVADEQLAAERAEEDDPLHHADEPGGEVDALERVARVLEPADQERDEHDRERVVAGERGDDDPRVAVARCWQAVRRRRAGGGSRRPGSRRRGRRARPTAPSPRGSSAACACRRSARRAASRRSPAPRSRTASASRAPQHEHREHAMPTTNPSGIATAADRAATGHDRRVGQVLALREDLRLEASRCRASTTAMSKIRYVSRQRGDVVEHQRGDDLVRREERPQHAPGSAPSAAPPTAPATIIAGDHQRRTASRRARARCRRAEDRADEELALAADVEEVHPERDRGAEAGEERAASPRRASR